MTPGHTDAVKQHVAAHWNRRAPTFDDDFGHSIRTSAERAAWDRILDLVLAGRGRLDALPHARLCIKCKAKEEDGKRR